ncbi:MAG TPA: MBL fold metallo-hydrolase [Candidatus Dormibacteraeota bacterium]
MVLHGARRRAVLVTHGGGHTSSDAFLHLPDDRVALMGDLLIVGGHPGIGHGDCAEWRRIIAEVRRLDLERLVPGHGPVGTPADLEAEDAYLDHLQGLARAVRDGELTRDEALHRPLPAPFASWAAPNILADNLRALLPPPAD